MKHIAILLVEDSPEKANAVERALTAIEGVSSGNITVAQDLVGAKRCLSEQQFDVAIIDIQIPIRFGNGPDPIGGVKLLQEIDQNATLRRPKYIIGLTQFAESVVQAGESFGERVFGIIHYSIESSGWIAQLTNERDFPVPRLRRKPRTATSAMMGFAHHIKTTKGEVDEHYHGRDRSGQERLCGARC